MNRMREKAISFLSQYAEGEPEVIFDTAPEILSRTKRAEKRLQALAEMERRAMNCTLCRLHSTRQKVVFGVGDPDADLMFIGEGPGAEEDRQGEPFVGRAGQLLDKILRAMNLRRSEVYIGNIIKCRPPGNRNPHPDEALACLPYLKQQIELIEPKVIVALGLVAAVYLLGLSPNVSVKSLRSRVYDYKGRPVVVTYHPAALLRSPAYKAPTWEDMQMVLKLLSGEIAHQSEVKLR